MIAPSQSDLPDLLKSDDSRHEHPYRHEVEHNPFDRRDGRQKEQQRRPETYPQHAKHLAERRLIALKHPPYSIRYPSPN